MNEKSIIIIEVCVLVGMALAFIFTCALIVGSRQARRQFRVKGYVRPPSGSAWLRFLLVRQYEAFDDETTQFIFRLAHGCLLAIFIDIGAIVILSACELLLRFVAAGPAGSM